MRVLSGRYTCHMSTPTPLNGRIIGRRIADRRTALHLEQTELAERASLSRAYVSRLESGLVPNPKVFDLARLAQVLDIALPTLVAPEAHLTETRYSVDMAEFEQQLAGLPPERAERVLRWMRESLEIASGTADLVRRN